ncbi:hypothetical protein C6361_34125 [Plantactinospora sp. BC1]|uniref:hypothetical protein n=1 Tax=Plantactinospora sp. BC1 TaxID=2108470 RepID=UPI000D16D213|nr:hypothetical protein [Plantactinospora sp. BC1]AVT33652.1 hypothetical protein C6361_34125 [Plantactinospora sp. BC1]
MPDWLDRLFPARPAVTAAAAIPPVTWIDDAFPATLPSRVEGGWFSAFFTARWFGDPARGDLRDWLRGAIVRRAERVTRDLSVIHLDTAQLRVNAGLREITIPADVPVRRLTVTATLTATEEARRTAAEWEELRTKLALRQMNDKLEIERLRHLREDIFRRPEVARTYWLDRHPDAMESLLDDRFERIAEKLGSAPDNSAMVIANVLRDFLGDLDAEHKRTLIDLLRRLLIDFRRGELVAKLPEEPA